MGIEERIKLLQSMPFFGAINEQSIELLLSLSDTCQISAGDYFYHQGDAGNCLYILEKGRVDIVKELQQKTYSLCNIKASGCFGELALINITARSASAKAIEDCQAIHIPASALHELYKQDSEQFLLIQMNMAREVSRRLQEADERWFKHQINIPLG
jgi:CRP-like cAMP-binding protein